MLAVPAGDKLPLLCDYMREKVDVEFSPATSQGFAVLNDAGNFVGAVLVSNITFSHGKPVNCEISCASDSIVAWRPSVCKAVFQYVFGQLGCVRCTSITKKNNTRARAFLEALNFQLEGRIRKGYDGDKDALIYGLLAEDCQFFEGSLNGQEIIASSASGTGPRSYG